MDLTKIDDFTEELCRIGWNPSNDAQFTNIRVLHQTLSRQLCEQFFDKGELRSMAATIAAGLLDRVTPRDFVKFPDIGAKIADDIAKTALAIAREIQRQA